jgi:protein-tyrosine-phosphatase
MNILFLCKGNVGRSQMAEGLFNKLYPDKADVFSAGTQLSGPEQTLESLKPGTDNVIAVMAEEGIDVSKNIRKTVTDIALHPEDTTTRVIYINTDELPELLLNDERVIQWKIEDPKGMSIEDTRKIRDEIKMKVIELGSSI